MKKFKVSDVIYVLILILVLIFAIQQCNNGKATQKNIQTKSEIKKSEVEVIRLIDTIEVIKTQYKTIEKERKIYIDRYNEVKKEVFKYDTIRVNNDTIKELVTLNKSVVSECDSIISKDNKIIAHLNEIIFNSDKVINEKDKQLDLYKNIKPIKKRFGLGVIVGIDIYGKPIYGVGLSYNIIRF